MRDRMTAHLVQPALTEGVRMSSRTPQVAKPARSADLLTLVDVLAELDVPKSTFFRWKATGKAPRTIKYPNGSLRVRRCDLEAWLAAHEDGEAA
jgi:predicted DNA-binding transcriptional regulator AlpA